MPVGEFEALSSESRRFPGEAVVLTTCQRLELLTLDSAIFKSGYEYAGRAALDRIAEVAAGLHSLVLGEAEVLGQVRAAALASPPQLREILDIAIASAREMRHQHSWDRHTGQALDYALSLTSTPAAGRLLVVGAGPVGRRVAQRATELGFDLGVAARRPIDWPFDCHFVPLAELRSAEPVDVVVTCLGAGAPELASKDMPLVRRLIVDLGTPRNVGEHGDVPLVTTEMMLAAQKQRQQEERQELQRQLREVVDKYLARAGEDSQSAVGALHFEVDRIRQQELARTLRLHPELPAETLDQVTRALVNQILHRPSRRLRQLSDTELANEVVALFAPEPGDVSQ